VGKKGGFEMEKKKGLPFSSRRLVQIDGELRDLKAELVGTFGMDVISLELQRDVIRRHLGKAFIDSVNKKAR